jgi:hypothetical protein
MTLLDRPLRSQHANLSTPKLRATFGIIDSTLLRVFAGPVQLDTRCFKAVPARFGTVEFVLIELPSTHLRLGRRGFAGFLSRYRQQTF